MSIADENMLPFLGLQDPGKTDSDLCESLKDSAATTPHPTSLTKHLYLANRLPGSLSYGESRKGFQ